MTTVRAVLTAALSTSLIALAAAGCTPGARPTADLPPEAGLSLTPHGDAGRWLDSAYAAGFGSQYATMNEVCAVTKDFAIEVQPDPMGTATVLARSLRGGAVAWQLEDSSCRPGALLSADPEADLAEARYATVAVGSREGEWSLVDPVTGMARETLPSAEMFSWVEPLTRVGDLVVIRVDGTTLVGVDDGNEAWSLDLPSNREITVLADGRAGVTDGLGNRLSVIDLETGEETMSTAVPNAHEITWASDGYVQNVQDTDPEYAFFDLSGREVDRTTGVSQYRFVPGPVAGVTFSVDDHRRAGTVVGVSGKGVPTLFADDQQRNFTQSGEVEDLPDSIISLQGVSLDGSQLLFDRDPEGLVLLDSDGAEAASWPLPVSDLRVESGRIVVKGDFSTTVLLPAGR